MNRLANLTMLKPFDKNWKFRLLDQKVANQRTDNAVRRTNYYLADECSQKQLHHPLNSDLSAEYRCLSFEQLKPNVYLYLADEAVNQTIFREIEQDNCFIIQQIDNKTA